MKFIEMQIRHVWVYGCIYSNGLFEVSMWDFDADDYQAKDGREKNVKAAWRRISHIARDMDRFNHFIDDSGVKETEAALDLFFEDFFEEHEENLFEDWELE